MIIKLAILKLLKKATIYNKHRNYINIIKLIKKYLNSKFSTKKIDILIDKS